MAADATAIYSRFHRAHRLDEAQTRRMCSAATFINSPDESRAL
jgi:hypothetical protein